MLISVSSPVSPGRAPEPYTMGEELAASISHGIGALLAMAGLVVLVVVATLSGDRWRVASAAIYGGSLVLTYVASTLYHGARQPATKQVLKIVDHVGVYLLIAGTYTPLTLVTLRGAWGWSMFSVIWGLAVVGMAAETFWTHRPRWIMVAVGLAMGWMVVVATRPLLAKLPPPAVWLIVSGGLAYSIGTVFYVWKSARYTHAVWHAWVIAGSALHYFAMLLYVVP